MKSYDYYYEAKRNLLPNASERGRIVGKLNKKSSIHISAACGKAMASVTCLLSQMGYKISASDEHCYPPMSTVLEENGIVCKKMSIKNLKGIDVFVPGNMLPPNSLEIVEAKRRSIPMMSGAEILGEILTKNKRSLVVAGTHGKTTTSSLLTYIFKEAGRKPSYMIGGSFQGSGESYSLGSKKTKFVIFEGDEYDCAFFDKAPKFLRYNVTSAIITSIEHDHIDLYPTFTDYVQAFQFLVEEIPKKGFLILNESAKKFVDLKQCEGKIVIYGKGKNNDAWYAVNKVTSDGTLFSFSFKGKMYSNIFVPLFGDYNIENTLSVIVLSLLEGLKISEIISGVKNYSGVKERQEIIAENQDYTVIRDFAHHPTAVNVTLQGLRQHYPKRRIVCVFEPRSITSRQKMFEPEYARALSFADVSIVSCPPFKDNDNKNNFIDVSVIKESVEKLGKISFSLSSPEDALNKLESIKKKGDVIVFMSNSDFGLISQKFAESI